MIRLLIVDDDPDVRDSLEYVLRESFSITLAVDGEDALAKLRTSEFDVVLLDMLMPVIDGARVVEAVRAESIEVPIVLGSAAASLRAQAETLETDYIFKPYNLTLLEKKLARAGSAWSRRAKRSR